MADKKPKVTETDYSFDVEYSKEFTVVVPKDKASTEAEAIKYSEPTYKEHLKQSKKG